MANGWWQGFKWAARWSACAGLVVALVACGGGSGGDDSGTSTAGGGDSSNTGSGSTGTGDTPTTPTTPETPVCTPVISPVQYAEYHVATATKAGSGTPKAWSQTRVAPAPHSIELGALAQTKVAQSLPGGMRQIGLARSVAQTGDSDATGALLRWQFKAGGGMAAAISFRSTGAQGIRLGILVDQVPDEAVLRFYAQGGGSVFEVPGAEITAAIRRNVAAGDAGSDARTYWAPDVGADEVTLEVELPRGTDPSTLRIAVPRLSHYVVTPQDSGLRDSTKIGQAEACTVDVSCDATYDNESNSVARMAFVENGSAYLCTGTLVNDQAASETPYFLSASHCVATQTVASSLTTYWFYRATSCNSGIASQQMRVVVGGATLLYANGLTDTSFMRLNTAPPAGVVYAGWQSATPVAGTSVADISHPSGDVQKLSVGSISGFGTCSNISGDKFTCSSATASTGNFVTVNWTSGVTESGSSGSALFASIGGHRYLVGQLTGGTASCTIKNGVDYFGRFDLAYTAALSQWLGATQQSGTTCSTSAAQQ
ncbi:endoproteinase ArgC [Ramlibacter sp. H39-3-26]|uniref:trypsin-like serine peptidase n=1 Tax=Curvibacter soli TaxID=3031331 RepID=UPI0023D9C699|nr:trypsin-like peptidase domain-containing protein [Ramlibacter sp. H39-3-26]MDF1484515.1 endoproteinase ArgC [Ramlibacter sp. H39-3-26]